MKQAQQSTQKERSAQPKSASSSRRSRNCFPCWPGMQNVLNLVRLGLYIAIAAWAAIVLGLAVNFDKMLVASDLSASRHRISRRPQYLRPHLSALCSSGYFHCCCHRARHYCAVRRLDLSLISPLPTLISVTRLLAPIALRHNPVSTLYELVSLAFLGVFWLGEHKSPPMTIESAWLTLVRNSAWRVHGHR